MNVVTVKFEGSQGRVDGHKISFSLGAWFSCVEQKDRLEGLIFNLGCTGWEASCRRGKLSAGRRRLVVQCDSNVIPSTQASAWWFNVISSLSDSTETTAGQDLRQDSQRLLCRHFRDIFFSVSQRKEYHPGEAY